MQAMLRDEEMANECTCNTVGLIYKVTSADFQGIILVEVLWKTVTRLLNLRITETITFHDMMHGFQAFCGICKAAPDAKLLKQFTSMIEAVLFDIFLYFQKAYNSLDWDRCLVILSAYDVVPMTIRLPWTYWDRLIMVSRAGGYFGRPFK